MRCSIYLQIYTNSSNIYLDIQAVRETKEATSLLRDVREDKEQLQEELFQLRLQSDHQHNLKRRLSVAEVRLESNRYWFT